MKNPLELFEGFMLTVQDMGEKYWMWCIIGLVILVGAIIYVQVRGFS